MRSPRVGRPGPGGGELGEILVSEGRISRQQLDEALLIQREDSRGLARILLDLGYVAEADLARALARRFGLRYVELTHADVAREAVDLVDRKVLRRHGVMPLRLENGRLVVAMSDPTDLYAIEDLTMLSGYPVTPAVAARGDIERAFERVFAVGQVARLLEEVAAEPPAEARAEVDLGSETGPDEKPIIRLVSAILQQAVSEGASDIHVEPRDRKLAVRFRVDGVLREVTSVPPKLQSGVVARLKVLANLDIAERRLPQDGRFAAGLGDRQVDLRVATLPTVHGEKAVLRLLDTASVQLNLTTLGFERRDLERYQDVFRRPYGTILVTGPTGSGKSTTLYATLKELNSPERNIITVEDPVEYRLEGINQIQVNPRAGLTFASGLRSILRGDPDVVMIGEIRDQETARIGVQAALTGHLVLATLHTNNAPAALNRLADMGVEPFLTSSAVDCVIAQRLARRLCERCRRPVEVDREMLSGLDFPFELVPGPERRFHASVGCDRCGGSGYRGRVGLYELMVITDEMRD
ncbi:MAG TPA: ATPase, T2SS/T4P/T4SS family, partial [Rubrobacteraceae bacterium]|nr:ATPase, T2SS/T4P/T4SS family [Rubrobacteraceae bacterium]